MTDLELSHLIVFARLKGGPYEIKYEDFIKRLSSKKALDIAESIQNGVPSIGLEGEFNRIMRQAFPEQQNV